MDENQQVQNAQFSNQGASPAAPMPISLDPKTDALPSTKNPKKKMMTVVLVSLVLLAICVLLLIAILSSRNNNNGNNNGSDGATETPTPTASLTPTPVPLRYIAYIFDENIWIVKDDGTGRVQITNDGDGNEVKYLAFDWKNSTILTYGRCDSDECKILNRNISDNTTAEVGVLPPFSQQIEAMEWAHDESVLAYLFTKGDFSKELIIREGSEDESVTSFAPPLGRGGAYLDGIDINFSADDSTLILLNTITDDTFGVDTITAVDVEDRSVIDVANGFSPSFDGNDAFFFLDDGKLRRHVIDAASSDVTELEEGALDTIVSPNGNLVAYWTFTETDEPVLHVLTLESEVGEAVSAGFAAPQWLDNDFFIAYSAELSSEGIPFAKSLGLVKLNRIDDTFIVLDDREIYNFDIE